MKYLALATDFDGTLATDGIVEESTSKSLELWRESGRKLILITGRPLDNLIDHVSIILMFDWVIAENGAVLYQPSTKVEKILAERPSEVFISCLRDRIDQKQQQLQTDKIVGVGDGENDCDFLQQCGYSVAVANALPEVKKMVNLVTKNSRGSGVKELIDQILNSDY